MKKTSTTCFKSDNPFLIIAAWVLVMVLAGMPLAARERRGSTVEVNLTDGRMVKGELLAVKGHDLIIHDAAKDTGFTVPIEMVSAVRLKRRSKVLAGIGIGFIGGMGVGVAMAGSRGGDSCERTGPAIAGLMCWGAATLIGGWAGGILSLPEEMTTNGREPVQIEAYLRRLRMHARNPL